MCVCGERVRGERGGGGRKGAVSTHRPAVGAGCSARRAVLARSTGQARAVGCAPSVRIVRACRAGQAIADGGAPSGRAVLARIAGGAGFRAGAAPRARRAQCFSVPTSEGYNEGLGAPRARVHVPKKGTFRFDGASACAHAGRFDHGNGVCRRRPRIGTPKEATISPTEIDSNNAGKLGGRASQRQVLALGDGARNQCLTPRAVLPCWAGGS